MISLRVSAPNLSNKNQIENRLATYSTDISLYSMFSKYILSIGFE